jgi:hypothetical protein
LSKPGAARLAITALQQKKRNHTGSAWLARAALACVAASVVAAVAAFWSPSHSETSARNLGAALTNGAGGPSNLGDASDGTWADPTTGLTWQVNPAPKTITWREAKAYCQGLSLEGRHDWRLPTISELRSLIRGCPAMQKSGSCGVTDSCLKSDCWNERRCAGCSYRGGSGPGGAYWPPAISGEVGWYWASSRVAANAGLGVWAVNFADGVVLYIYGSPVNSARCVR